MAVVEEDELDKSNDETAKWAPSPRHEIRGAWSSSGEEEVFSVETDCVVGICWAVLPTEPWN